MRGVQCCVCGRDKGGANCHVLACYVQLTRSCSGTALAFSAASHSCRCNASVAAVVPMAVAMPMPVLVSMYGHVSCLPLFAAVQMSV